MRRALRASRLVASVVAQILYLAFEEAMRARAAAQKAQNERAKSMPSVHEMPTLPGTVAAPFSGLETPTPIIRVVDTAQVSPSAPEDTLPEVLSGFGAAPAAPAESIDVASLLETLRRDVGCARSASPKTHGACRAAEALGAFVDRDAVLGALEETVMAAGRPDCVRISSTTALGRSSRAAARRALYRMLGVAKSRASWSAAASDRDLVSLLLHTLDA